MVKLLLLYLCALSMNFAFASKPMPLVVDTDMGDDDIMALMSLLRNPTVQVKAITVTGTGLAHANEGLRNLRRLLYLLDRQEIPIASGREQPLQGGHPFPDAWRASCDILLDKLPSTDNAEIGDNALELLRNVIESSPEKTTILALGPLTNIAELFKWNPDLIKKVEKLHIMGGAVDVPGNLIVIPDNEVAEWNIFADPHAAKEVLKTGIPIYLIALDATNHTPMTQEFYDHVKNHHKTPTSALFSQLLTGLLPIMHGFYFWDVVAVETLLDPNLAHFEPRTIDIVTAEGAHCGQTISCESGYPIQLATKVDGAKLLNVHFDTLNTEVSTLPAEIRDHPLAIRLSVALQMGREAGRAILAVKESRNLQTQIKADSTPVTLADQASNKTICQTINSLYPEDGILSEEAITGGKALSDSLAKGVNAEWTWVIDPLDGTKAFIKSTGLNASNLDPRYQGKHYGVHIGLLCKGEPVLGVNYYPEIDTFYFVLNSLSYQQIGTAPAIRVINKPVPGIQPILNPTPNEREIVGKIYQKLLGEVEASEFNDKGLFLDSFGYKMTSIAEGNQANLFIAPAGGPGFWDVCSMLPFVEAAGGKVTDWEGNPIDFRDMSQSGLLPKGAIVSMSPEIHKQVISIIAELTLNEQIPRYGQKNL